MTINKKVVEFERKVLSEDHDLLAYFFQVLACIIWTASYIYTNEHNVNVFQVNIAKGVIGAFLNHLVLAYRGYNNKFQSPRNFKWLLILNLCILAYFYALPFSQFYLPLPIVHTIGCSSIAIIYTIDYFLNGITITKMGGAGVAFALVGVFLMANNRLIMSIIGEDTFDSKFVNYHSTSVFVCSFVALLLFVARTFNCYALVKYKDFPEITVFQLNYHNNLVGVFTAAIGYMLVDSHVSFGVFWPSLITIGVGQFVCTTLFFYSLKLTKKTGNVMVINTANIIVAFLISYFRYGEKFNVTLILGSSSIILGMVLIIFQTKKPKKTVQINQKLQQN